MRYALSKKKATAPAGFKFETLHGAALLPLLEQAGAIGMPAMIRE
jgi:hypothetical protein